MPALPLTCPGATTHCVVSDKRLSFSLCAVGKTGISHPAQVEFHCMAPTSPHSDRHLPSAPRPWACRGSSGRLSLLDSKRKEATRRLMSRYRVACRKKALPSRGPQRMRRPSDGPRPSASSSSSRAPPARSTKTWAPAKGCAARRQAMRARALESEPRVKRSAPARYSHSVPNLYTGQGQPPHAAELLGQATVDRRAALRRASRVPNQPSPLSCTRSPQAQGCVHSVEEETEAQHPLHSGGRLGI
ncbi:hypothetical protein PAL_GLEAN10011777 [Pteropus alecto]|uniref:Uncharacterized protein n=1 Tax=Pteropus alecto TaxID=9402 RepID=L5KHS2_PTEAL|nr:hypothetical protein PAL_GLEAN10011777 [Pteropus alecto]